MATKKKAAVTETAPVNGGLSVEEPVVSGEFPEGSEHPTVDEAREMFEGNPGLAEVLTDRGWVRRVDILGGKKLGLDGLYR